ncbi:MAG: hypothetical protein JO246_03085, partial [Frankiaceae bacterium]|nr:hypothetical protein [Frankiaceae bacterium]
MDRSVIVVSLAVLALAAPDLAQASSSRSPHAIKKCRQQTVVWKKGHKVDLNKGPKQRSHSGGVQSITDGAVSATYQTADQAKYLDVEAVYPQTQPQMFTRLKSLTIYPTKGHKKTFKPTGKPRKDYVYKYDMTKSYGQMQLPVSGSTG